MVLLNSSVHRVKNSHQQAAPTDKKNSMYKNTILYHLHSHIKLINNSGMKV